MLFLFFGPPLNQCVANHPYSEAIVGAAGRQSCLGEFFSNNNVLIGRQAWAAIVSWPHGCEQLIVSQNSAPFAYELCFCIAG